MKKALVMPTVIEEQWIFSVEHPSSPVSYTNTNQPLLPVITNSSTDAGFNFEHWVQSKKVY